MLEALDRVTICDDAVESRDPRFAELDAEIQAAKAAEAYNLRKRSLGLPSACIIPCTGFFALGRSSA
jgi:hypothetical protein